MLVVFRQERQHKDKHPHAADPVREAAPEKQTAGQRLDIGQDRRACCRKARNRLEKQSIKDGICPDR